MKKGKKTALQKEIANLKKSKPDYAVFGIEELEKEIKKKGSFTITKKSLLKLKKGKIKHIVFTLKEYLKMLKDDKELSENLDIILKQVQEKTSPVMTVHFNA